MNNLILIVSCVLLCPWEVDSTGDDLLENSNGDLEIAYGDPGFYWVCHRDCTFATETEDVHGGNHSLRVTQREVEQSTPRAEFTNNELLPGHSYYYSVHLKYLNLPAGFRHFNITMQMKLRNADLSGNDQYDKIAEMRFQRLDGMWFALVGDFRMPTQEEMNYDLVQFYLILPSDVDFLFDTASLVELIQPDPVEWREEVKNKIQAVRTNLITVMSTIPEDYDLNLLNIKVEQKQNAFPFGSAVKVDDYQSNSYYREFFHENFQMAVAENAFKWKQMEPVKGEKRSNRTDIFLEAMEAHNISGRYHTVLWGKTDSQPSWLLEMTDDPAAVKQEAYDWIEWVFNTYEGRLVHWDVYNEYTHVQFFEEVLGEDNFILDVFTKVEELSSGDFYINDFDVVRTGTFTSAQVKLANWLLSEGKKLDGIGAQTHIRPHSMGVTTAIEFLEHRFRLLCEVGLPVFSTELSVHDDNVTIRANKLDEVLHLLYADPCVNGIVYWGYWENNSFAPDSALATGDTVEANEAGIVWNSLVRNEWMTKREINPVTNNIEETFSGHHGTYGLVVSYNGTNIMTSEFTLVPGEDLTVTIPF